MVGVEWGGRFPNGRGVNPLQPRMALYLGQRCTLSRIPLQHTRNQTERKIKTEEIFLLITGLILSRFHISITLCLRISFSGTRKNIQCRSANIQFIGAQKRRNEKEVLIFLLINIHEHLQRIDEANGSNRERLQVKLVCLLVYSAFEYFISFCPVRKYLLCF